MRVSALLLLAIATSSVPEIVTPALSQTTSDSSAKPVRISGRIIFPEGGPPSLGVQLSKSDDQRIGQTATAGGDGVFSFIVPAGNKYRISLGSGIKTASKTVDTATLKDVDVGDMVFEYCPPGRNFAIPKAPANAPMIGSLSLDQIAIEPQHSNSFLSIGAPEPPPYKYVEPPPCWSGLVSADHRADWEGVGVYQLRFDQYVSIEGFVGSKVKSILVMDEWIHVQVQDRAGHYWYIRLWPAVD